MLSEPRPLTLSPFLFRFNGFRCLELSSLQLFPWLVRNNNIAGVFRTFISLSPCSPRSANLASYEIHLAFFVFQTSNNFIQLSLLAVARWESLTLVYFPARFVKGCLISAKYFAIVKQSWRMIMKSTFSKWHWKCDLEATIIGVGRGEKNSFINFFSFSFFDDEDLSRESSQLILATLQLWNVAWVSLAPWRLVCHSLAHTNCVNGFSN